MWCCPNCKREFKRVNQGHYCKVTPKNTMEYIESQPLEYRSHLEEIAAMIKATVPDGVETIKWSMPTYEKGGKSISFYACKNHVSLAVGQEAIVQFAHELCDFETNKNVIYFPYHKSLPQEQIEKIVKWCME